MAATHTVPFAEVSLEPDGTVSLIGPRCKLTAFPDALRLDPGNKLAILRKAKNGNIVRKGVYCKVSRKIAAELRAIGLAADEKPAKPRLPKWEKHARFEIGSPDGMRPVVGLRWECFGIAQYFLDDDGNACADEWAPKPLKTVTHLPSGLSLGAHSIKGGLPALKRLALEVLDACPRIAEYREGGDKSLIRDAAAVVAKYRS